MSLNCGCRGVCASWLLLHDSVDLARFRMERTVRVLVLASPSLKVPSYSIVRVASNAAHRADIVFRKTRFGSSVDTAKGGEDDGEEASESGLQLSLRLSEVCLIDAQGASAIRANTKALFEPN